MDHGAGNLEELQKRLAAAHNQAQVGHEYLEDKLQQQGIDLMRREAHWSAQTSALET